METINWDAVAALSEALGVIVVVASLIFVGVQMRQNTLAIKLTAAQAVSERNTNWARLIPENEHLAEILWEGLQGVEDGGAANE